MSNTTLSLGTHTPKPAVASRMRLIAQTNLDAAKLTDMPVIVAELRAHGNVARACETVGIGNQTLQRWRKRDPALNRDVCLAVQFAGTDSVNYAAWVVTR